MAAQEYVAALTGKGIPVWIMVSSGRALAKHDLDKAASIKKVSGLVSTGKRDSVCECDGPGTLS
jgi:hypothetical protein